MEKKYKLTDGVLIYNNRVLHRIQALKDLKGFREIKAGSLGGWVASEKT